MEKIVPIEVRTGNDLLKAHANANFTRYFTKITKGLGGKVLRYRFNI